VYKRRVILWHDVFAQYDALHNQLRINIVSVTCYFQHILHHPVFYLINGSHILVMMRFENMAYGVTLSFIVIIKQL